MPTTEDDALLRELMQTFQAEASDHLQALNQALLQLERRPGRARRQELLRNAFREAHSLKGAARAVSRSDIEGLAHATESVLQQARDDNLDLDPATCDVLYDTLDAIQQLLDGRSVVLDALQARLVAVGGGPEGGALPASSSPPAEALADPASAFGLGEDTIRVAVDKLDNLMAQAGELLVSKISSEQRLMELQSIRREIAAWPRTWREIKTLLPHLNSGGIGQQLADMLQRQQVRMQVFAREVDALDRALSADTSRLGMVAASLQDEVRRVRMVPFQTLVLALERTVRDAAHSEDKQAVLLLEGSDVELDKKVLEMLKDPLMHLLRNAVGHGIEAPAVRQERGKPVEGQVRVAVQQRGSEVRIVVSDDGGGFDLEALREAGRRAGAPPLDKEASMEEVIALAFLPGVSTSKKVTAMAGRGVGLDVVRQQLEALQGRIEVESVPGQGTTFRLSVPSTLTMTRGLLVRAGDATYVLPLLSVEKIVPPDDIFNVEGQPMIAVDDNPLPLVALTGALGQPLGEDQDVREMLAVVVSVAEQRLALLVDDVMTELELAVKPLGKPLKRVRNVAGAALLGDGRPVIVLNPADLVKSARGARPLRLPQPGEEEQETFLAHILVVDDSITTRTLEKNILETSGYQVAIATDGIEALERLDELEIDLIVCDLQMPRMDGFELTRQLRESERFRDMPIILVTSLESQEDRERGMMAGANAYIVKRGFDQAELLATIEQYL